MQEQGHETTKPEYEAKIKQLSAERRAANEATEKKYKSVGKK
jgi:hypothetical protein